MYCNISNLVSCTGHVRLADWPSDVFSVEAFYFLDHISSSDVIFGNSNNRSGTTTKSASNLSPLHTELL